MRYLVGFLLALAVSFVGGCDDEVEVCFVQANTWVKDNPPPLAPPLPSEDMLGTYTLWHFHITVRIGDEIVGNISDDEFESYSGRLEIEETTITSTVTIEGQTETLGGPYTTTVRSEQHGVFVITSESYDLAYSYLGNPALVLTSTEPICEMTTL